VKGVEARLYASADAEADGGILVSAEVFAVLIAQGEGEGLFVVADGDIGFAAIEVVPGEGGPMGGFVEGELGEGEFVEAVAEVPELYAGADAEEIAGHLAGDGSGKHDGVAFLNGEGAGGTGDIGEVEVVVLKVIVFGEAVRLQR